MTSKCPQLDSPGRRFEWKNKAKMNMSRFGPGSHFVRFFITLGASLGYLGPSWDPFCPPKASFWSILGSLGPSWPLLEHILELVDAILALLGSLLASSGLSWALLEVPSFNFDTPMTVLVPCLVPVGGF